MEQIFAKVVPIILFIAAGYIIKRTQYLDDQVFKGIKKLVFDFALPSVLFVSFIQLDLKAEYIGLTVSIMLFLLALNMLGRLLNFFKPIASPILPYILSGTALGLLGIPLYGLAFGIENAGNIGILAVGHESFVWIIFMSLMRLDFTRERFSFKGLKNILTSPLVLSIFLGILVNLLGYSHYFYEQGVMMGVMQSINYFAQLGTPLILLIVGYDLEFDRRYTRLTVIYVLIRRICVMTLGLAMEYAILSNFMEIDRYMHYALFMFFILPPPFAFSTFIEGVGGSKEMGILGNNIVVMDTVLCILTFTGLVFYTGMAG